MILESDLVDDPSRNPSDEPHRVLPTATRRHLWAHRAYRAAVTLSALGAFVAVERSIHGGRPNALDRRVVAAMGRARRPWLNVVVKAVTFFGGVFGTLLVSSSALLAARSRPRIAAQIAVGSLGAILAELALKRRFVRERPRELERLAVVHGTSFPSGHSMAAACVYLTLAYVSSRSRSLRTARRALLTGAGALAFSVGASRVYLGVHWPTDALGGLALGTAWASATESIFDWTAVASLSNDPSRACASLSRPLSPTTKGTWKKP